MLRFEVGTATEDSATILPTGSRVIECRVEVTTPYSLGATIEVGRTSDPDLYQTAAQNVPQVANTYTNDLDERVDTSMAAVRVTIGGAPAAGAATVIVLYADTQEP